MLYLCMCVLVCCGSHEWVTECMYVSVYMMCVVVMCGMLVSCVCCAVMEMDVRKHLFVP